MTLRPQLRLPILAAALAATAASAWAAYERGNPTLVPAYTEPRPLAQEVPAVVANDQGLSPNEEVVTERVETTTEAPIAPRQPLAPVVEAQPREPAITIEQPRLTLDERIQGDVMDLLARNPNLSGRIGVVTKDQVVTLTGYTTTSGMAWRAGRDARGVQGVRHVVNEIRPRVGAITS
jgi:hypothetical protein